MNGNIIDVIHFRQLREVGLERRCYWKAFATKILMQLNTTFCATKQSISVTKYSENSIYATKNSNFHVTHTSLILRGLFMDFSILSHWRSASDFGGAFATFSILTFLVPRPCLALLRRFPRLLCCPSSSLVALDSSLCSPDKSVRRIYMIY